MYPWESGYPVALTIPYVDGGQHFFSNIYPLDLIFSYDLTNLSSSSQFDD